MSPTICDAAQRAQCSTALCLAQGLPDEWSQRSGHLCGIGLEKEGSALHAAFTLPYSNGPVEGKINKLKYIKRSMDGRGGFPLLRQRVLKAG